MYGKGIIKNYIIVFIFTSNYSFIFLIIISQLKLYVNDHCMFSYIVVAVPLYLIYYVIVSMVINTHISD